MIMGGDKLFVIGFGPGNDGMLTDRARNAIKAAHRVLNTRDMPLPDLISELKKPEGYETSAVLVSGDSGFFSAAKMILRDFSHLYDIEVIPGISSVQYLSARLKISYDDAVLTSLHGRNGNIVAKASYNRKVFTLIGGENSVQSICRTLCRHGLGDVIVSIGERLSYADERIINGKAAELRDMAFDGLSIMLIENPFVVNPHAPLYDADFIRGDVPMTKEEIRWLSIQKLCINPQDTVFDIGAGTGSVAVEMARRAFDGFVFAIEAKEDACALVRKNAARHGAFNMDIINGEAPGAFDSLPVPDKAFIGGSMGNMDNILGGLLSLNPNIRIVANAITLQTLNQTMTGFERYGVADVEIICVNIAKSKKSGSYDMMVAQNPVYIISGGGGGHV